MTEIDEVEFLPEIECSACEIFRSFPDLAWIAEDEAMPSEIHRKYAAAGTSWIAEADGQRVGFLCAESDFRDLHIQELSVRQEWQGKGIGRKLMNTAIEYARRNQFKLVTLTTFREVPWNAPFYRSLGFEVIENENLGPRLKKILETEAEHGFSPLQRCAMRLRVLPENGSDS